MWQEGAGHEEGVLGTVSARTFSSPLDQELSIVSFPSLTRAAPLKKKSVLNKERYASQPASLENFSYRLIPSFSEMGFLWC